ncbi:MAG TPA: NAD(+) diphosphatase [Alteraurantiacibacter sp.]|jgi:NAD+ diphosphatase
MSRYAATIAFAGARIDRADHVRADPARLEALKQEAALLLELEGLIPATGEDGALRWRELSDADHASELVFLGLIEGKGAFAAVPTEGDPDPAYTHRETWNLLGVLQPDDLAIYGGARSLLDWHARHPLCPRCGSATQMAKGGWQRDCTGEECRAQHFPRVDPVTIMLVEHEDRLLLGRNPRFPPNAYSALAGFVEPGETIEEAVAREVLEEAGVAVRDVRYVASQPWPFPAQLMIGCHAMADDDKLTIDTTELADARWFTRADVVEAMEKRRESTSFVPPLKQAIAFNLLHWWLEEE